MGKTKSGSSSPIKKKKLLRCEKKQSRPIHTYTEGALAEALRQIRQNSISVRAASRTFAVPRSTIQDRLAGRIKEEARRMGPPPVLTKEEEKLLVEWCINMAKCGFPRKMDDLLNTVQNIIKEKDMPNPFRNDRPGKKWFSAFMRRNPELAPREAEGVTKGRAIITEEFIRKWFTDLEDYLKSINALDVLTDPERVFNGDETSFALCPKTGKVIAPKGYKNVYQIQKSNEKETLTVLLVFSANGTIAPPCVVFPYIRPPKDVKDSIDLTWYMGLSESGWMRADVFYEYVANGFNKWVEESKIKKPVLFFVDGHKSHMTLSLSKFCAENDIILYALPANTTHIMQPADVSVFRPFKSEWKQTVRNWQNCNESTNEVLTRAKFCPLLKTVLEKNSMTESIKNGFRKCGLYPFDANSVDYTKCIQNTLERLAEDEKMRSLKKQYVKQDYDLAEEVIESLRSSLELRNINVDVVINEITNAKQLLLAKAQTTEQNLDTKNHNESLIITNKDDNIPVGTYEVDDEGVLFLPFDENYNISEYKTIINVDGIVQNYFTESIKSTDDDEMTRNVNDDTVDASVQIRPDDSSNIADIIDVVFTEQSEVDVIEENNEEKCSFECSSKVKILNDITIPTSNKSTAASSFQRHLIYPLPIQKPGKRTIKDKGPSCISSAAWQDIEIKKEQEKAKKLEEKKRKQEERLKRREELEKKRKLSNRKRNTPIQKKRGEAGQTGKENDTEKGKENEVVKTREICDTCCEELISDTEDNDLKNIGCDNCSTWYHLKCTMFQGQLYEDVASRDFLCDACRN